jgi:diaminopimelate epimerase
VRLLKGHGTRNDFLVLPDLDGAVDLSAAVVRALCDRRAGIGADGVLRVVRSENDPEAKDMAADAEFFMDYRNADGSTAEMCGNGLRVCFAYLQRVGLVGQVAAVATRGGIRRARAGDDTNVTVQIGSPRYLADRPVVTAAFARPLSGAPAPEPMTRPGVALEIPNPHVIVELDDETHLADLDLSRPPLVEPRLPHGQNVEFAVRTGTRQLRMRVHERGVGETMSCGTGIGAAAVALAGPGGSWATPWTVDVPGGTCEVSRGADGMVELTGPAVLVGEIEIDDGWLTQAQTGGQA